MASRICATSIRTSIDLRSNPSVTCLLSAVGGSLTAVTVTFIGRKLGLYTGPGVAHAGTVVFDDLSVPGAVYRAFPGCPWLRYPSLPSGYRLAARDANVYKQALGHLLVVGGERSMGGDRADHLDPLGATTLILAGRLCRDIVADGARGESGQQQQLPGFQDGRPYQPKPNRLHVARVSQFRVRIARLARILLMISVQPFLMPTRPRFERRRGHFSARRREAGRGKAPRMTVLRGGK